MKKGILVVENDQKIRNILVMHIESEFNVEIYTAKEMLEAYTTIKDHEIHMIVAKYDMGAEKSSLVYSFLQKYKLDIPFLLITEKYPSSDELMKGFMVANKHNAYFKYPITEEQITDYISEALKLAKPSDTQNYKRIRGSNIASFCKESIPIYILDDENKYIMMTNFTAVCPEDDFYFVGIEDYQKMSSKINEQLIAGLSSKKVTSKVKMQMQYSGVRKIHNTLGQLGLSKEEIQVGESIYNSSVAVINKSSKISKLLGNLINNRHYTYELSMMCNYISLSISYKTPWHSEHSLKKLSMGSLFQDISLQDDHLAKITDLNSPEFHNLNADEKEQLLNHPVESMKLVSEVNEVEDISNNIQDIVLCHHERPLQKGFPKKLPMENLSGISCIYILAHEFSHRLLEKELTIDVLKKIQIDFERDYSVGRFRIPYTSFLDVFKNK